MTSDKRFDPTPGAFVPKPSKTLKLDNKKSKLSEIMKERNKNNPSSQEFEVKADAAIKNNENKKAISTDKTAILIASLRDKTLVQNKTSVDVENEKELRKAFVDLVTELNNPPLDDLEAKEGIGASAATSLMLKILFEFRDRINQLEYELSNVKRHS